MSPALAGFRRQVDARLTWTLARRERHGRCEMRVHHSHVAQRCDRLGNATEVTIPAPERRPGLHPPGSPARNGTLAIHPCDENAGTGMRRVAGLLRRTFGTLAHAPRGFILIERSGGHCRSSKLTLFGSSPARAVPGGRPVRGSDRNGAENLGRASFQCISLVVVTSDGGDSGT